MFTIEEITLMSIYINGTPNRKTIINSLKSILDIIDDTEMKNLVTGVIRKLTALSDTAFERVDFSIAIKEE